tara:strand:+ start:463 stop:645 length:183 start_codon:yes stop_codon:yes gene_type:complete
MAALIEFNVTLWVESEAKCLEIQERLGLIFDEWIEEGLVENDATSYVIRKMDRRRGGRRG